MRSKKFVYLIINALIIIVVVIELYPLVLMIFGSLKTASELSNNPAGIPVMPTFENYKKLFVFQGDTIIRSFLNSVGISVFCTVLTLLISSLAAFAFAKCRFKGRDIIFALLIATMIIPTELTIPPLYVIFSKIHWINSYWVQIFPFIANTFALFMLRQFMISIPDSLVEAAKIDGASLTRTFFRIMLPCSMPVLSALSILVFITRWNEYLWPTIMINNVKFAPIMQILPTIGLGADNKGTFSVPWELVLAGCTLVTVPMVVVFLIFQDKFMKTVTLGAVKG